MVKSYPGMQNGKMVTNSALALALHTDRLRRELTSRSNIRSSVVHVARGNRVSSNELSSAGHPVRLSRQAPSPLVARRRRGSPLFAKEGDQTSP